MRKLIIVTFGLLVSSTAFAGRGGSTAKIKQAIDSGSVDAIIAEVERAETLACLSCIEPVKGLVDHPEQRVRDVAGWWLGRRGVRDEVIAEMTARFSAEDPVAARNAADVLAGMRDFKTLPALAAYLTHPLDEESGVAAARAIAAIGHPNGLVALKAGMASSLAGVRAASAAALREVRALSGGGFASDAQPLLPLLGDTDLNVRRQAAVSCGVLRDKSAVSALGQVANADASPMVRKAAVWALGEIRDGSATQVLIAAQSDPDPFVRSVATAALANLK
jgi:HEAT repeat protein